MDNSLDPIASPGTAPDDPLRAWFDQLNDPGMAALMVSDPDKAKELMIQRGIAPPPHASEFADPYGNEIDPNSGMPANPIVRTNPNGTITGNITNPAAVTPPAPPVTSPIPPKTTSAAPPLAEPSATSPLDPQSEQDAKDDEEEDAKDEKKKPSAAEAFSGFSKSLAGVKPIQPPPLAQVGTPGVRTPTDSGAPNLANILALAGQQAQQHQLAQTLGRLLVAGKA